MKNIKIFSVLLVILGFQSSFACACAEAPTMGQIMLSLLITILSAIIVCLPILYFCLKIKKFELSIWALIIPVFLAVMLGIGLFFLGQQGDYIRLPFIHKAVAFKYIAILGLIFIAGLWFYPIIYAYRRGQWFKYLYHPLRK